MIKAYLFDVDGVLTNPSEKKVLLPEIFDHIVLRLENNFPVCFNTGRSLTFIEKEILDPLEKLLTDKGWLDNIFAIGEKGGVWLTYTNGKKEICIDKTIVTKQFGTIQAEIKKLIAQKFSDMMFFDETKKTMISIEMHKGKSLEAFRRKQEQLVAQLQIILQKHNGENALKIDPTTIATDIENKKVGKALGAKKFIELLQDKHTEPDEFLCFGDSASDYDMFEQLQKLEKKVQLIFVGEKNLLAGKKREHVVLSKEKFDKGTRAWLEEESLY